MSDTDELPLNYISDVKPDTVLRLNGISNTKNYKLNFPDKAILLKENPNFCVNSFESQLRTSQLLANIIDVPKHISFDNGAFWVQDTCKYWTMQNFIDGRFNNGSKLDYHNLCEFLKKYKLSDEKISKIFDTAKLEEIRLDKKIYIIFREKLNQLKSTNSQKTKIIELINFYLPVIDKLFSNVHFAELEYLNSHIDLHPQNIIFTEDSKISIIDLDSFKKFPTDIALSFSIFKNFRNFISQNKVNNQQLVHELNMATQIVFNGDKTSKSVLSLALVEYLRRANNVFLELTEKGESKWYENLFVQLLGACEIAYCRELIKRYEN